MYKDIETINKAMNDLITEQDKRSKDLYKAEGLSAAKPELDKVEAFREFADQINVRMAEIMVNEANDRRERSIRNIERVTGTTGWRDLPEESAKTKAVIKEAREALEDSALDVRLADMKADAEKSADDLRKKEDEELKLIMEAFNEMQTNFSRFERRWMKSPFIALFNKKKRK